MSDSRTHTPTPRPWKHETGPRLGGQYHDVVDQNGILIAEAANFSEADADDTDARDAANVEHIVHCVNSHDGLVEALREIAGGWGADYNAALSEDGQEIVNAEAAVVALQTCARRALEAAGITKGDQ